MTNIMLTVCAEIVTTEKAETRQPQNALILIENCMLRDSVRIAI